MIIAKMKPLDEILEAIKKSQKILVLGCDGCVAIHQAGGIKQGETLAGLIEIAKKTRENKGIEIATATVLRQCDTEIVQKNLTELVKDYDTILSLACGAGVQTIAEIFQDKTVIPANNTMFIGKQDFEEQKLSELCKACGDCILHETGGICPITRCAKGLLNGPCGGQADGKCEVGGWKKDCAWILIYNRLKERGRLDLFLKFRPPRDYRVSQSPRETMLIEHFAKEGKAKEGGKN